MTAITSTIMRASWQLPPVGSRNGIITGFKLFFKRKSYLGAATVTTINSGSANTKDVTGLVKYTEYEFQMLAYTSAGDGPKSSSLVERTLKEGGNSQNMFWSFVLSVWLLQQDKNFAVMSYQLK